MTFKHNDRVTCEINGTKITDARISIDKNGDPYICQNEKSGVDAEDKLGYKYSWRLSEDFTDSKVSNLRPAGYQQGDILVDKNGDKHKILGVCGEVYLMSCPDCLDEFHGGFTKIQLDRIGYSLLSETETLEIGGHKYDKQEVENLLKGIKEVK